MFVDGLKKGMDTVEIPNVFGELIPLDQRFQAEYQTTATGTRINLKNYSEDMYTLCFKAAGQE